MNRTVPYIFKNYLRQSLVFAAAILIVLTSCSIKSSIKSLLGVPAHTEQHVSKKNGKFFGSTSETCVIGEPGDTKISQAASLGTNLLPALFLAAAFLFPLAIAPQKEPSHPLFGNFKIRLNLPLFLLYRKLILYHSS